MGRAVMGVLDLAGRKSVLDVGGDRYVFDAYGPGESRPDVHRARPSDVVAVAESL